MFKISNIYLILSIYILIRIFGHYIMCRRKLQKILLLLILATPCRIYVCSSNNIFLIILKRRHVHILTARNYTILIPIYNCVYIQNFRYICINYAYLKYYIYIYMYHTYIRCISATCFIYT